LTLFDRGAIAAVFALFCATSVMPLQAQNTGVAGTVLDQVGKPIPGASVTVKNEAITRATESDAEGRFSVTGLAGGAYTIETTSPGFAKSVRAGVQAGSQDVTITLFVDAMSQSVTVQDSVTLAADLAPAGNILDATSAKTEITSNFIRNFMSPVSDYAEVLNIAPGTFSTNPNGIGLGQAKLYFRGFSDGQYTITFDGIPFEDTNSPTHHSWASFPSQWISSTDFDRSPGQAADFGPTNFGGSINMKSPELQADPDIRGSFSYGSFNTKIYSIDGDSGLWGPGKKEAVLFNFNQMTSDGYQTFNNQQRDAGYAKFQHRFSDKSSLSLYGGVVDIWNTTPNTTNPTRAQVAQFGDNFLLTNTPFLADGTPDPYYYKYNTYHVQTDFEYLHFGSDLGNGWNFDTKAYTTRYWNKQFYQNGSTVNLSSSKPSGVDKLNGYRHVGDTAILSKEIKWGVFRSGLWYDWAYTDRYQIPSNILTQQNTPLGNFHEHFITQSFQPFAEFEWRATQKLVVTAGIKAADYNMALNQYQDNGKTVGCLGGKASTDPATGAPICIGGAQFASHTVNYNNWLPTLTARYRVWHTWSVYGQFAEGSVIPPSNVFDVPGGNVLAVPKPTVAKTYQAGSVLKLHRWTFDSDFYYIHFQNGYQSYIDPATTEPVFIATGPSNTKGFEAETSYLFGHGFSVYSNFTFGSAKYQTGANYPNGGLWVAQTPSNIQAFSVLWQHRNWDIGFIDKRVGHQWNDNGSLTYTINGIKVPYPVNEAVSIDPFNLANFYVNYTIKNSSRFRGTKIQFAANNLADSHNIVGVTPATAATATVPYAPSPGDLLNLLPGRSFSITVTGGYAPRR
jgi:iron complex outermembrane receptor protein